MSDTYNSEGLKTLLVAPSEIEAVRSFFVWNEGDGLGHKVPLGLLSIATYLRSKGCQNVSILDAGPERLNSEETAKRILSVRPNLVGFSVMTELWYTVWKAISIIKEADPRIVVVVGGPHVSIYPELCLEASKADIAVAGDGELALHEILTRLGNGTSLHGIDGVFFRDKHGEPVCPTNRVAIVEDLDKVPIPERNLVDLNKYGALLSSDRSTTMISSRGCPCRCVFCKLSVQHVVSRSPESVISEFEDIARLGFREVEVYDDTFTWEKQRVLEICNGLAQRKLGVSWSVRSRVNRVDREILEALRRAGCKRIHFGIETGNEKILRDCRKGITKEQARIAVSLAKEVGLEVLTYYMIGFLDETLKEAEDTLRFAMELDSEYVAFAILIPYPGTAIYEQALERGIIPLDHWREFSSSPSPCYEIPSVIENLITREEMMAFVNRAHSRFYFSPKRVLRQVWACRSWEGFRKRLSMALNLLFRRYPWMRLQLRHSP